MSSVAAIATDITFSEGVKIIFGLQIKVGVCPRLKNFDLKFASGRSLVKFLRDDQRSAVLFRLVRQALQQLLGDKDQIQDRCQLVVRLDLSEKVV